MSMNLGVNLVGAGIAVDMHPDSLCQTPTAVTYSILGERGKRWQDQAKDYLAWFESRYADDIKSNNRHERAVARAAIKAERKKIGDLWHLADKSGGRLEFYAM